jgi:hypothetical protein
MVRKLSEYSKGCRPSVFSAFWNHSARRLRNRYSPCDVPARLGGRNPMDPRSLVAVTRRAMSGYPDALMRPRKGGRWPSSCDVRAHLLPPTAGESEVFGSR